MSHSLQTISEEYRRQQQELHKNPNYGVASLSFAPVIADLIRQIGVKSVSDYGAGKQNLRVGLEQAGLKGLAYFPYDPAFPDYGQPQTADLVCCIDVLEHIEPELIDNVLQELAGLTRHFGFFTIHMKPAAKVLPDGRNAHLIQKPSSWWLAKLVHHFEVRHLQTLEGAYGFWVLVQPRELPVAPVIAATTDTMFEQAKAHFEQGVSLLVPATASQAEACFRASLACLPDRTSALTNLSSALMMQGKFDDALATGMRACELEPANTEAGLNVGLAHEKLGQIEAAMSWYDQVIEWNPAHTSAWTNKSSLLDDLGQHEEAVMSADRAIAADAGNVDAWVNKGVALYHMGLPEKALSCYAQARVLDPDSTGAAYNEAMARLAGRDFAGGWPLFELRWKQPDFDSKPLQSSRPRWEPGVNVTQTVMVWAEQGIGDQVFWAGALPDMFGSASKVVVAVTKRLVPLFQRSFPQAIILADDGPVPEALYETQIPMGSLGSHFRRSEADFVNRKARYITPDAARVEGFRRKLNAGGRRVVGLSWISKNRKLGKSKSLSLEDLQPILAMKDCVFVDLQYGDTTEERANFLQHHGVEVKRLGDVDTFHDIDGLCALIDACDVVVSVSNTTVHLAGALGKRTMLMLPFGLGKLWYWHDGQTHSQWYPSVEILRASEPGRLSAVPRMVADRLQTGG